MEQTQTLASNNRKKRRILIGCAIGGTAILMAGTGIGIGYAIWYKANGNNETTGIYGNIKPIASNCDNVIQKQGDYITYQVDLSKSSTSAQMVLEDANEYNILHDKFTITSAEIPGQTPNNVWQAASNDKFYIWSQADNMGSARQTGQFIIFYNGAYTGDIASIEIILAADDNSAGIFRTGLQSIYIPLIGTPNPTLDQFANVSFALLTNGALVDKTALTTLITSALGTGGKNKLPTGDIDLSTETTIKGMLDKLQTIDTSGSFAAMWLLENWLVLNTITPLPATSNYSLEIDGVQYAGLLPGTSKNGFGFTIFQNFTNNGVAYGRIGLNPYTYFDIGPQNFRSIDGKIEIDMIWNYDSSYYQQHDDRSSLILDVMKKSSDLMSVIKAIYPSITAAHWPTDTSWPNS